MLATHGVSVRFGGNVAVSDVNIEVLRDEIVGLIGTNGAGKSTLMNAIGGYVPSEGKVVLLGKNVERLGSPARSGIGLGRTFQAAAYLPKESCLRAKRIRSGAKRSRTGGLTATEMKLSAVISLKIPSDER